jgi:16S rRNA (cytosine967-C5)-methyltransferase
MPASPARTAAFDILLRVEKEASYASELLHSPVYERLSTADHGLATEIVMGVLRWRSRLDDEISAASAQSLSKLDLEVLVTLRMGLYQFRWLDRIPQRAALNESVELVKRARKSSAASFVNAILRKLVELPKLTFTTERATPDTLAGDLSHPLWLVERWARQYGIEAAQKICQYDQSVPITAIRLRTSTAEGELNRPKVKLAPGELLRSARRIVAGNVTKIQVDAAQAVIQDEGSQLVASLVGIQARPGSRVLDCCAAPGGKTIAIADHIPRASITAIELHPHRARILQKLLRAAKASDRVQVVVADARHLPISCTCDRVLADVPCSGTGTLARNPEIKWRIAASDLRHLQELQIEVLRSGLAQVGLGGRVIYSTCSLEKEENEEVIEQVLGDQQSFRLVDCGTELDRLKTEGELTWPDTSSLTLGPYLRTVPGIHRCDGFFAAIVEKV